MENASKTLIIAGAILIAILLISIGIIVMNSVNDPINQSEDEAKQQAIQMFNSKYTVYAGEQSAAEVKQLLNVVMANWGSDYNKRGIRAIIYKNWSPLAPDLCVGRIASELDNSKTYIVTFEDLHVVNNSGSYYPDSEPDGFIDTITIKEK